MIFLIRIAIAVLLLSVYPNDLVIAANKYIDPDDEKTILEADRAVKLLGRDRGSIQINYRAIDIVGLSSNISSKSINVEASLKTLGAKKIGKEIQISLSGDVLFGFDKWDIQPEAGETLNIVASVVKELKKKIVIVEGHTDSKGSDSYNLKLSQNRADSVKNWFMEKNVLKQIRFVTKGYGETEPIAPNTMPDGSDNPMGRAKNRRVEIKITD